MGSYKWIYGENALSDLKEAGDDSSVTCLNFVDVYFSAPFAKRMEATLRGRRFDRITLMNCRGRVDLGLAVIFDFMEVECLKLDSLQIKKATADALAEGIASCSSLKTLQFQALGMTEYAADSLLHGLRLTTSLESLFLSSISSRQSNRKWTDILLQAVQSNKTLKSLAIARVRGMEPDSVLNAVKGHESLETLSIACLDGLSQTTLGSLHGLAKCSRTTLKTLKLSMRGDWTGVQHLPTKSENIANLKFFITISTSKQYQDMTLLGRALQKNGSIEFLSLAHCGLQEEKIRTLVNHLGNVEGLKRLNLYGNSFDSRPACQALLRALEENRCLERIDLPVGVEESRAINHLLDCNRAGRKILQELEVHASLWPHILNRAGSIDYSQQTFPILKNPGESTARRANAIFHLLQGPALCF